jgi:Cysteine-rich CPXCG
MEIESTWLNLPDDDVDEDEASDAELHEATLVSCPYCGQSVELLIDAGGGPLQEYVEDCEICCQPWSVRVALDPSGQPNVSITTLDDE